MQIRLPISAKAADGGDVVAGVAFEIAEMTGAALVARQPSNSIDYVMSGDRLWRTLHAVGINAAVVPDMPRVGIAQLLTFDEEVGACLRYAQRHGSKGAFDLLKPLNRHFGRDATGTVAEENAEVVEADHPDLVAAIERKRLTLERLALVDGMLMVRSIGPAVSIMPTAAPGRPIALHAHPPLSAPWAGSLYRPEEAMAILSELRESDPERMTLTDAEIEERMDRFEIVAPDLLQDVDLEPTRLEGVAWWMMTSIARANLSTVPALDLHDFAEVRGQLEDRARAKGAVLNSIFTPLDGNDVFEDSPSRLAETLRGLLPAYDRLTTPLRIGDILEIYRRSILVGRADRADELKGLSI